MKSFDLDTALRQCFDRQMFVSMVDFFFSDSEEVLAEMGAALSNGDTAKVAELAHHLRGTVLYLGAPPASDAAYQVERTAASGDLAETTASVRHLETEVERLREALAPHHPSGIGVR